MIFDLLFVRHGVSYANILSNKAYGTHILYPDPELTNEGIRTSSSLSPSLIACIERCWVDKPYTIGASRMIRAQQTAYYMIASVTGLPIHIFPHIGEKGFTLDNVALPVMIQEKIIGRQNPTALGSLKRGHSDTILTKSNWLKFIEWATQNLDCFGLGIDVTYRAVIFTHSNFLKSVFTIDFPLGNNDVIHSVIDTDKINDTFNFEHFVL